MITLFFVNKTEAELVFFFYPFPTKMHDMANCSNTKKLRESFLKLQSNLLTTVVDGE